MKISKPGTPNSRARRNWAKAHTKVRVLIAMSRIDGIPISDTCQLTKLISPERFECPTPMDTNFNLSRRFVNGISIVDTVEPNMNQDMDFEDMDRFEMVERFFRYVERGNQNDIENLQKMLDMDPKKNTRMPDDPERLMNALNKQSESAIHVAARNNLVGILSLILRNKANPYQIVKTPDGKSENALDVATRWKSKDALRHLLENIRWSEDQLKNAKKLAPNAEFKKIIESYMKTKRGFCGCFSD